MTTLSKEDVVRMAKDAGAGVVMLLSSPPRFSHAVFKGKELNNFATLARADLVAENERLKALSVTNIMVDVVPGDGSGLEVYAKSVDEVVNLLSELGEKVEDLESVRAQLTATRTALAAAEAREKKLREAAHDFRWNKDEWGFINAATEIIDKPRDDSALREMIAGAYEECAKLSYSYSYMSQDFVALSEELRALAEKAGK